MTRLVASPSAPARSLVSRTARTSTLPLAAMAVTAAPRRTPRPLSERLDREWYQLCRRPRVLAKVRSWELTDPAEPPIVGLDDLLLRCGHRGAGTGAGSVAVDPAAANACLGRIVARAATEPLAARIALQRILPGLLAIVRREQLNNPVVDAFDQLIGEAWIAITSYRADRRPHRDIAAQLLHDARHRAFTHPRRRRSWHERPGMRPVTESRRPAECSPFEELVHVLADARTNHQVPEQHFEVIRGIVRHGNATRYANHDGLNPRTVRNHRDRAVAALRQVATAV